MKIFEGNSEEERLHFTFNLLASYIDTKSLEKCDEVVQMCLDAPEKCEEHPSVALTVLMFTTAMRKTSPKRAELFNLVDKIYSKKLNPKQYAQVILGLK